VSSRDDDDDVPSVLDQKKRAGGSGGADGSTPPSPSTPCTLVVPAPRDAVCAASTPVALVGGLLHERCRRDGERLTCVAGCTSPGRRLTRHSGQVELFDSHWSMHAMWKKWPHAGSSRSVSCGSYSHRHTEHVTSSSSLPSCAPAPARPHAERLVPQSLQLRLCGRATVPSRPAGTKRWRRTPPRCSPAREAPAAGWRHPPAPPHHLLSTQQSGLPNRGVRDALGWRCIDARVRRRAPFAAPRRARRWSAAGTACCGTRRACRWT
jgi:hypothetical protein